MVRPARSWGQQPRSRRPAPQSVGLDLPTEERPSLAWLAQDDQAALDQACDKCLSHTDIDLGICGRAIGLLARVLYGDLPTW